MSIDPDVNAMQEVILDILERLANLEEQCNLPAYIVAETEEEDGVLSYVD